MQERDKELNCGVKLGHYLLEGDIDLKVLDTISSLSDLFHSIIMVFAKSNIGDSSEAFLGFID